jgi:hypothetical protein
MGAAYEKIGQYKLAEAQLVKAAMIEPHNTNIRKDLERIKTKQEAKKEAKKKKPGLARGFLK